MTTATLTAVPGVIETFKGEGFQFDYPVRRPSAGFGYGSDMMHLAVNRDDPAAFMFFLEECGGPDCDVLLAGSVANYAALHGATECLRALFASGAKYEHPLTYWLKKAENPSWGPRAARQPGA